MVERKLHRIRVQLTPTQQAALDQVRQKIEDEEKDEIKALATKLRKARRSGIDTLEQVLTVLKHERESQGISLGDMEERTGMAKSNLSKLENSPDSNPTVATLVHYADALGKRLVISLVDK